MTDFSALEAGRAPIADTVVRPATHLAVSVNVFLRVGELTSLSVTAALELDLLSEGGGCNARVGVSAEPEVHLVPGNSFEFAGS